MSPERRAAILLALLGAALVALPWIAGSYVLSVTNGSNRRGQPLEIAEIPLEVRGTTVTDVKVATARGSTVSGRRRSRGCGWPSRRPVGPSATSRRPAR